MRLVPAPSCPLVRMSKTSMRSPIGLLLSQLNRPSDISSSSGNKDQKIKSEKKKMRLLKLRTENGWLNYTVAFFYESLEKKTKSLCRQITECAISTAICYKNMTVQLCYIVRSEKNDYLDRTCKGEKKSLDKPEILFHTSLTTGSFCSTILFIKLTSQAKPKL